MTKLQNKYNEYLELREKNAEAMTAAFSIRTPIEKRDNKECNVITPFSKAMDAIKRLAWHYKKMDSSVELGSILEKVEAVKDRALNTISSLQIATNLYDYDSDVVKGLEEELLARVENISEKMQDPKSKHFKIDNAETPHDLIRYFHQKGVEAIFNMGACKKDDNEYECGGTFYDNLIDIASNNQSTIKVIDLEDRLPKKGLSKKLQGIEGYEPLKAIVEFYKQKKLDKQGGEAFQAMVSSDKLLTQITLGDHYCEIEAQIKGSNDDYVKFFFRDTPSSQYKNAKNRTKYVVTILRRLGFKLEQKGRETKAEWKGKKHAKRMLKEILRLNASTKNLDLDESCLQKYPKKAVNTFFEGKTNIGHLLMKWDGTKEKDEPMDDDLKIYYPNKK